MGVIYNQNIVRDGLFVHVDAGNKKSYPGSGTILYNLAKPLGYGAILGNGTIVGSPLYSSEFGGILYFSGVSAAPQYVNFGAATNINPLQESTFETWIRSKGVNISGSQGTGGIWSYTYGYRLDWTGSNSIGFNLHNKLLLNTTWLYTTTALSLNTWYYVACSTSGFKTNIYINGKLNNSNNARWYGSNWPTSSIALGLDVNNSNTNNFWGDIAIGRAYKRCLSEEEIFQNYNAEKGRFGL